MELKTGNVMCVFVLTVLALSIMAGCGRKGPPVLPRHRPHKISWIDNIGANSWHWKIIR